MRKYVDIGEEEDITVFSFRNFEGETESVTLSKDSNSCLTIVDDTHNQEYTLFKQDVPNMIKALQAAYDEWGDNNGRGVNQS